MSGREMLLVFLLGHVLGDFYLQSDRMAEKKGTSCRYVLFHALLNMLPSLAAATFLLCAPDGRLLWIVPALTAAHAAVDLGKTWINRRAGETAFTRGLQKHGFFIDQVLHLAALGVAAYLCRGLFAARSPALWDVIPAVDVRLLPLILTLLLIFKPAARAIKEILGAIRLSPPEQAGGGDGSEGAAEDDKDAKKGTKAGRYIGMLERFLVLALALLGQYGAVGGVIAAKSIARFKELDRQVPAEYYLVGTLLSFSSLLAAAGAVFLLWR